MRVVLFSRVPRWYSFKNERLSGTLAASGVEVAGIFVEKTPTFASITEWGKKLGWGVFAKKAKARITGKLKVAGTSKNKSTLPRADIDPPVFYFDSHNSESCVSKLSELGPDLVILRGCGIIREPVLRVPKLGVINPHYALLPDFRGMDVTEWSALCGAPIAVSVHSVNKGVDTGSVLRSETIKPTDEDSVGSLRDKSAALAVRLLHDVAVGLRDGLEFPENTKNNRGKQYFQMHSRLKDLANQRLRKFAH